jgi:hypothetical protein
MSGLWKNKMRLYIFISTLFFIKALNAQRIISFNLLTTPNSVTIKFTLSPGPDCGGYEVFRSNDSLNFISVCDYSGICGVSSRSEEYSCTDNSPVLNQTNLYRIILNNLERSEIKGVYVAEPPNSNIVVYPNPVVNLSTPLTLKLVNEANTRLFGFLYDQYGRALRKLDIITDPHVVSIDIATLANGLYFVRLSNGSREYSAKFIIFR